MRSRPRSFFLQHSQNATIIRFIIDYPNTLASEQQICTKQASKPAICFDSYTMHSFSNDLKAFLQLHPLLEAIPKSMLYSRPREQNHLPRLLEMDLRHQCLLEM
jgi:hypothetical protein